jgi:hypothetical protein
MFRLRIPVITFFFINYRPIGKGSNLENRYKNLFELTVRMTTTQKNMRPNCEEILSEKDFWSLDLSELKSDYEFNSMKMKFSGDVFHSHFIEVKSRSRLK